MFRGLIGPMPEGKNIVRYESPEVFETLTKEWSTAKSTRRSRRREDLVEDAPSNIASSCAATDQRCISTHADCSCQHVIANVRAFGALRRLLRRLCC